MSEFNESKTEEKLERTNPPIFDFDNTYLLKVGTDNYVVRFEEKKTENEVGTFRFSEKYESTVYDAFNESVICTTQKMLFPFYLEIRQPEDLHVMDEKGYFYKLVSPENVKTFGRTNFLASNFEDVYLFRIGTQNHLVKLQEREIKFRNSEGKLVKGYELTIYNASDNSVICKTQTEFSVYMCMINQKSFKVLGENAYLYMLLSAKLTEAYVLQLEYHLNYLKTLEKYRSIGVDVNDAYFLRISGRNFIAKLKLTKRKHKDFTKYYYSFYDLCTSSLLCFSRTIDPLDDDGELVTVSSSKGKFRNDWLYLQKIS